MNPKNYYCGEYTISIVPFGGTFNFHIFYNDVMYLWDLKITSLLGIGICDYYHMMLCKFNGTCEDCKDGDTLIAFPSIDEFEKKCTTVVRIVVNRKNNAKYYNKILKNYLHLHGNLI